MLVVISAGWPLRFFQGAYEFRVSNTGSEDTKMGSVADFNVFSSDQEIPPPIPFGVVTLQPLPKAMSVDVRDSEDCRAHRSGRTC